jgi:hypothetical protein
MKKTMDGEEFRSFELPYFIQNYNYPLTEHPNGGKTGGDRRLRLVVFKGKGLDAV